MNKKLMALALAVCLFEQGIALGNEYSSTDSSCCPVAQPACCPSTGRRWRMFSPRPYRSGCCPRRRTCRPARVRTYRAKKICCPRLRCCRPKPTCCPMKAPACEAPACVVNGETTVVEGAGAPDYTETLPAIEAAPSQQPEEVESEESTVEEEEAA